MAYIPFLTWQDTAFDREPVAIVPCDFSVDTDYRVECRGEYHRSGLQALYVYIDNSANNGLVTVVIGPRVFTINQFSRQTLFIDPATTVISISGTVGSITATFMLVNRNPTADTSNDLAINTAVAQAVSAFAGQNVSPIINSQFDVWPQGAGPFTSAGMQYGPEGWMTSRGGGPGNITINRVAGVNATYSMQVQRPAADANLTVISCGTQLQSADSEPYAGRTVTLTGYIRCGANFSAVGSQALLTLINGIGNDQNMYSGGFTGVNVVGTTICALTTTLNRFSLTAGIPNNATQLGIQVSYTPTGVAGADDSIYLEQFQIDQGTTALAFRPTPFAIEQLRCLTFFERMAPNPGLPVYLAGGQAYAGNAAYVWLPFIPKRIVPAVTLGGAGADYNLLNAAGANIACNGVTVNTTTERFVLLNPTVAAGLAGGNATTLSIQGVNGNVTMNARM